MVFLQQFFPANLREAGKRGKLIIFHVFVW